MDSEPEEYEMPGKKREELTEEELREAAGGKQTKQKIDIDGPHHIGDRPADNQTRSTRRGKLTFRRTKLD